MSTDKLRAEFEAWAGGPEFGLSPAHFEKAEDGEYINMPTDAYWLCFRAGRASAVVELPAKHHHAIDVNRAHNNMVDACRAAIEAAGVTVK